MSVMTSKEWASPSPPTCRRTAAAGAVAHHRDREGGATLILALFFTVIVLGLILSGSASMDAANKQTEVTFRLGSQVREFADAGLIDALDWFRRQASQPVTAFAPVRDEKADPPILDTDDPAIGIVRSFRIARGVWGRYEVRKFVPNSSPAEPEVCDVSLARGSATPGKVWRLVSRGYVYRLRNPGVPFNQVPNQILATSVLETEIRRLALTPPAPAAICVGRGDNCRILTKGRILGGEGTGIVFANGTGSPTITGEVAGKQKTAALTVYDDSLAAVFGVNKELLRSLSDDQIFNAANFPARVPLNHMLYVEANLDFDSSRPLKGTGILYVQGNVTIQAGSNSFFNGLLYVDGDLTVNAPALLSGTFIVTGRVVVAGAGDLAEINYDESILNELMVAVGQYRQSASVYPSDLKGTLKN